MIILGSAGIDDTNLAAKTIKPISSIETDIGLK